MSADEAATVAAWQRQRAAASEAGRSPALPGVYYLGLTVARFTIRENLESWQRSRDLLAVMLQKWLQVPVGACQVLSEPTAADLERVFTRELPAKLKADSLLIVYLGTHHLSNGRILLGKGTETTAAALAQWLTRLPATRIVFLADVCYGANCEREGAFPDKVVRVYAGSNEDLAYEAILTGTDPPASDFFKGTAAIVNQDLGLNHTVYSLFGLSLVQALRQEITANPPAGLHVAGWVKQCQQVQTDYRAFRRNARVPIPVVVNPQPWVLAGGGGARFAAGGEGPGAAGDVAATPLPPPDEYFAAVEHVLSRPDAEVEIGRGNLLIGRIYNHQLDVDQYLRRLDEMAATLKPRVKGVSDPREVIRLLAVYLFDELKLQSVDDPYAEDFLLDVLLEGGKGRCMALSALYLALAERLKLPLVAVVLPEHIFVRWQLPNEQYLNIETTAKGIILADQDYRKARGVDETAKASEFYLRPLSRRATLATYLSPLGNALGAKARHDEAVAACRRALAVVPNDAELWNNLGRAYRRQEKRQLAVLAFRRALEINPSLAEAENNLGTVVEDPDESLQHFRKAVQLAPEMGPAWENLVRLYCRLEKWELAWSCIQRCDELTYPLPQSLVILVRRKLQK